jgi:hypothetical protein
MDEIPMMPSMELPTISGLTHAEEVRARALQLAIDSLKDNWLKKDQFYARAREFEQFILTGEVSDG